MMNFISFAGDSLRLNPPILLRRSPPHTSLNLFRPNFMIPTSQFLSLNTQFNPNRCRIQATAADASSASSSSSPLYDIDMVSNRDGTFSAKQKKVVVLWDLDNKPPRGPPYKAAMALRRVAEWFGDVVEISAYANRHAFIHLPHWVLEQRRERRQVDILERKGVVVPPEPYICSVCGRKCKTNLDLKKHFKQLHERERQKKVNRMNSLKGKKRQKFKEKYIVGNHKYNEAARELLMPKVGYGLAGELRRAGVFVKTVEDKPQAADWALKRQMQHSMSRGIDWLFLVSDDSDFTDMLRRARGANLGTVVVGDFDRALGREADLWVPWGGVENGEIIEKDLLLKRRSVTVSEDHGVFSSGSSLNVAEFGGSGSLDRLVNELAAARSDFTKIRDLEYDEGEAVGDDDVWDELSDEDDDLIWDSEDDDTNEKDGYL